MKNQDQYLTFQRNPVRSAEITRLQLQLIFLKFEQFLREDGYNTFAVDEFTKQLEILKKNTPEQIFSLYFFFSKYIEKARVLSKQEKTTGTRMLTDVFRIEIMSTHSEETLDEFVHFLSRFQLLKDLTNAARNRLFHMRSKMLQEIEETVPVFPDVPRTDDVVVLHFQHMTLCRYYNELSKYHKKLPAEIGMEIWIRDLIHKVGNIVHKHFELLSPLQKAGFIKREKEYVTVVAT